MPNVVTNKFLKTLSRADFFTANVTCTFQKWNLVGEYTVPAQQEIAVGATEIINGGATGSCAYMRFDGTGAAQITGQIKVMVADANDQGQVVVQKSSAEWSASATPSRIASVLLQEDNRRAQQDSKIQIWFYPTAYSTLTTGTIPIDVTDADTAITLPVSVYTVRMT